MAGKGSELPIKKLEVSLQRKKSGYWEALAIRSPKEKHAGRREQPRETGVFLKKKESIVLPRRIGAKKKSLYFMVLKILYFSSI